MESCYFEFGPEAGFCTEYFRENPTLLGDQGTELCEDKFGPEIRYSEQARSCFCRTGFGMTVTSEGLRCLREESESSSEQVGGTILQDFITKIVFHTVQKGINKVALVHWAFFSERDKKSVQGYKISVHDLTTDENVFGGASPGSEREMEFVFSDGHRYLITIAGFSRYGKMVFWRSAVVEGE